LQVSYQNANTIYKVQLYSKHVEQDGSFLLGDIEKKKKNDIFLHIRSYKNNQNQSTFIWNDGQKTIF